MGVELTDSAKQKTTKKKSKWVCQGMENISRSTDERRPPALSLSAKPARDSSKSMADLSTRLSQQLYDSNSRSHFSPSARNDSPRSTSRSRSPVVVASPRSMPSDKPSPAAWSPTTRNTSTSTVSESSRTSSSSTTEPWWSPIPDEVSPRSLAVQVPVPDTRNLTVNYGGADFLQKTLRFVLHLEMHHVVTLLFRPFIKKKKEKKKK